MSPDDVDHQFQIDAKNGFRSWAVEGDGISLFLGNKYSELQDPLCIRKFLLGPEHMIRSAWGVRIARPWGLRVCARRRGCE